MRSTVMVAGLVLVAVIASLALVSSSAEDPVASPSATSAPPQFTTTTRIQNTSDVVPGTRSPQPTTTTTTVPPMPEGAGAADTEWDLVFADEFDGHTLTGTWRSCYWWAQDEGCTNESNRNLQWYVPDAVAVADGSLRLTARTDSVRSADGERYDYVSGLVTTDYSGASGFAFEYGYVESRMRLPSGAGLWSALWMLPITHESRPEIDIMEVLGNEPGTVEMHLHTTDSSGDRISRGEDWSTSDLSDEWHTFAIDWNPDRIIWYVDGQERWRMSDAALVPAEPLYLIANLAVGGDWPGPPDQSTVFPATVEIDYVRVWQEKAVQ